jgi:hypothetical protein
VNRVVKMIVIYTLAGFIFLPAYILEFFPNTFVYGKISVFDLVQLLMPFVFITIFYFMFKEIEIGGSEFTTTKKAFMVFFLVAVVFYAQGVGLHTAGESIERDLGFPENDYGRLSYLFDKPVGHLSWFIGCIMLSAGAMLIQLKNPMAIRLRPKEKILLHTMALIFAIPFTLMMIESQTVYVVGPILILVLAFFSFIYIRKGGKIYQYPALLYFMQGFLTVVLLATVYLILNHFFPQVHEFMSIFSQRRG